MNAIVFILGITFEGVGVKYICRTQGNKLVILEEVELKAMSKERE